MQVKFKTCDVRRAFEFLQTEFPDLKQEDCPLLCDALSKDIVRVTDPQFHTLAVESEPGNEEILQKVHKEILANN